MKKLWWLWFSLFVAAASFIVWAVVAGRMMMGKAANTKDRPNGDQYRAK